MAGTTHFKGTVDAGVGFSVNGSPLSSAVITQAAPTAAAAASAATSTQATTWANLSAGVTAYNALQADLVAAKADLAATQAELTSLVAKLKTATVLS